jgi:hypothetical protein
VIELARFDVRGGRYHASFLIDQRRCDIMAVLGNFLQVLEENKESHGVEVKSINTMKKDEHFTMQIDFEEFSPSNKSWERVRLSPLMVFRIQAEGDSHRHG